jgi:endoglucanase
VGKIIQTRLTSLSILTTITLTTLTVVGAVSPVLSQTTVDSRIRLNSVGFLPDFPKKATIAAVCGEFRIIEPVTGTALFTGVPDSAYNIDTRENVWIADFSEFKSVGTYCVEVPGVGRSANFIISDTVFKSPFKTMMLGMYLWRCGTAVDATYNGVRYNHAACHIDDGNLQYVGGGGVKNATGGWHDAGDYNKYVVNSGVTVGLMLKAWEHFHFALDTIDLSPVSKSGNISPYLVEVKWNLDWVAKMQLSDGKVSHKMTTIKFGSNVMPEKETDKRYFMPWSTPATGSFVGMLAQAARIYAPYNKVFADSCLTKAKRAYNALTASPFVAPDTNISNTGHYYQNNDTDKRLWAAAEMWETTGESKYLEYLEGNLNTNHISNQVQWANVGTMAALTYLDSKRRDRNAQKVEDLKAKLISVANGIADSAMGHGYGRTLGSLYYWGANGTIAGNAYILHSAYRITGDEKYRYAVQDALSHLLGRNYYGRSFVTGVGFNPPKNPHCRRSEASGKAWPGYLIGGPHNQKPSKCAIEAGCWTDNPDDYYTNEIAINWNAPMIYALAGVFPDAGTFPAPAYPGQPGEGVSVNRAAMPQKTSAGRTGPMRVVRTRGGRLDIPVGAKVYGLDGRLIAHKRNADSKVSVVNKTGIFLIETPNKERR